MIWDRSIKITNTKKNFLVTSLFLLSACSDPASQTTPVASDESNSRYNTQIRWTSYGIPHVKADDWGSLAYGFAYATARDAICTIARDVLMVNGDLSRQFGPENGNFNRTAT